MPDINKEDIVVISGLTENKSGARYAHRRLASVLVVGKYDAFVILTPKGSYDRPFRVPLAKCQKIKIDKVNFYSSIKKPKIGNLVYSFQHCLGKDETHIGTVDSIIDKPGEPMRAILEHSTNKVTVNYDTLIVLED